MSKCHAYHDCNLTALWCKCIRFLIHAFDSFSLFNRTKWLKNVPKDDTSPMFLISDNSNLVYRHIYDLLNDGVHGIIKKEIVLAILADIAVSFCRCVY